MQVARVWFLRVIKDGIVAIVRAITGKKIKIFIIKRIRYIVQINGKRLVIGYEIVMYFVKYVKK